MPSSTYPLHVRAILRDPETVMARVHRAAELGLVDDPPNAWQVCLGVLRMTRRLLFRWDSVGTEAQTPVRDNWRAWLLQHRPARLPFLVRRKLIAPFDLTGMLATPEYLRRHVMAAYHAGDEFHYDLQILSMYPGELERLRDEVRELIEQNTPEHQFLRDLNAYEGYHEALAAAVDEAIANGARRADLDDDPDWSLAGYLKWCARQPESAPQTWALQRAGRFDLERGLHPLPRPGDEELDDFLTASQGELMRRLQAGHPIDPDALDGKVYRGVSLGLPSVIDQLAWKTFQKAFKRDTTGQLMGWNVRLRQEGYAGPLRPKLRKGEPFTFGHFRVVPTHDRNMPSGSDHGLLLDYAEPAKPLTDPMRFLRDPIVALRPDDPSTLLGWSYLELGPKLVPTPSFFLLSHPEPLSNDPS